MFSIEGSSINYSSNMNGKEKNLHQIQMLFTLERRTPTKSILSNTVFIKLRKKNNHICCYIFPMDLIDSDLLPKIITINNKVFIRFYDRVYIPKKPTILESSIIFDYISPNYEKDFIKDIEYNLLIYRYLFRISKNPAATLKINNEKKKVLDIGCGTGISSIALSNFIEKEKIDIYGVDVSLCMVNNSKLRGIKAVHIQSTKLPFPDNHFEIILGAFVSHFIWDENSYKEIIRTLKPYGSLSMNLYKPQGQWKNKYKSMLLKVGFSTVYFYKEEISTNHISRVLDFLVATK